MSGELSFGTRKHREFLDKLIDDEGVRSEYEKDPVKVLHGHGIGFDPANKPAPGQLPDLAEMRAGRDKMVKAMDDAAGLGGDVHADMHSWNIVVFGLECMDAEE